MTGHADAGSSGLTAQLRFAFAQPARRTTFVVSPASREAVTTIEAWPDWPGGTLVLTGPAGSGKSHLARAWAERSNAAVLRGREFGPDQAGPPLGAVLVEAADAAPASEALFHLLNRAARGEASVLLTARISPRLWLTAVPDLRSRMNALPVVELGEPDDAALHALLTGFFSARQLRPSPELLNWLVRRIERSARGAETAVAALDEAAMAQGRPLSRALAREVLGAGADEDTAELPFGGK